MEKSLLVCCCQIKMKILYNGAEAILYKENNYLIKERISKGYRHKFIDDKKRKLPTRKEFKLLFKAHKVGVNVPEPVVYDDKNMRVAMEFIKGERLKDTFDSYGRAKRQKVAKLIGEQMRLMHDADIVHGDLTTSNMLFDGEKVYFVDFGLGFVSEKEEGKAVDIHLLKQALESKHYRYFEEIYNNILEEYKQGKVANLVLERLKKVEQRGRYKRKTLGS